MKRAVSVPGSIFLIMAAVTCTMGTLISGFKFDVELWALAVFWLIVAVALPASSLLWRGKGVLLMIPPVFALIIWRLPEIVEGAKGVLFYITTEFNKWLYVPVLFKDVNASVYEITAFFTAAGVVLAFLLYVAICLYRNTMLAFLFTAPIVFLTFIIVYNQPDPWYLIGILAVYLTLMIGNSIHTGASAEKRKRMYTALALASLLLLAAYAVVPSVSYRRPDRVYSVDSAIRRFAERTGLVNYKTGAGWPGVMIDGELRFYYGNVGVANAGVRTISDQPVMGISVSKPGVYYLRGASMQHFDGRVWSVDSESLMHMDDLLAKGMPAMISSAYNYLKPEDAQPEAYMAVEWTDCLPEDVEFTPYYSLRSRWVGKQNEFIFFDPDISVLELAKELPPESYTLVRDSMEKLNRQISDRNAYLQIDGPISAELRRIAERAGIEPGYDRAIIADMVADFVSQTGGYTLSPYVTPEDEDFTLYFLETSQQGYCIHFATAATMMLRALGVPARYTSGFVAVASPQDVGKTIVITDRQAHAWVEVYYDDVGWLVLEVTPPATGSGVPDGRPHSLGPGSVATPPRGGSYDYPDDMPDGLPGGNRRPGGVGAPDQSPVQDDAGGSGLFVLWFVVPVVVAGLLVLGFYLNRRALRRRLVGYATHEDPNRSVVLMWRFVTRLNKKYVPPGQIEGIALKARFSQHRISPVERAVVAGFAAEFAGNEYQGAGPLRRLWLKWGLGV